ARYYQPIRELTKAGPPICDIGDEKARQSHKPLSCPDRALTVGDIEGKGIESELIQPRHSVSWGPYAWAPSVRCCSSSTLRTLTFWRRARER
nr:hypothetical protein [Tanacetum cinerariifolium]